MSGQEPHFDNESACLMNRACWQVNRALTTDGIDDSNCKRHNARSMTQITDRGW